STSSCPSAGDLQQFALGQLDESQTAALLQHLEECSRCVELLQQVQAQDTLLAAMRAKAQAASPAAAARLPSLIERLQDLSQSGTGPAQDFTVAGGETCSRDGAEPSPEPAKPDFDFLAPAQQPGEIGRLAHYRVLKLLGQGGMGMVFQAE